MIAIVGLVVSAAAVAALFFALDLGATLNALAGARIGWVALAAVAYLAIFPLRGLRWRWLLRGVVDVDVRTATEVFAIGFLANNVLPARLGDVARAFVLKRRAAISGSAALSSVAIERIFDGLVVVGLLAAGLGAAPPDAPWVTQVGVVMGAIFLVALLGSIALAFFEARALALADFFLRPLPARLRVRLLGILGGLSHGLSGLRSARTVIGVALVSIAIWVAEVGVYALLQPAFGLTLPLPALVVTMAVLSLGLSAPSSPAFVGVFEGLVVSSVGLYGPSSAVAMAFALALHAVHFATGSAFGLVSLARHGLKFRDLSRAGSALDSVAPPPPPDETLSTRNRAWT